MNAKKLSVAGAVALAAGLAGSAWAQVGSQDGVWTSLPEAPAAELAKEPWVRPMRYAAFTFDIAAARAALAEAPMESAPGVINNADAPTIDIPLPDGSFATFRVVESPIMEPGLAAKFPEIKSYAGEAVQDPSISMRFDVSPAGFRGIIHTPEGQVYIDPLTKDNYELYASYFRSDMPRTENWSCYFDPGLDAIPASVRGPVGGSVEERSGPTLKTYRVAIACTGEYSIFHDGPDNIPTVAESLAAINTSLNRVNFVYEREVAVRMVLVANNNLIVFLDPNTDPYTNNDGFAMLSQNQTRITNAIGSANYDIGHVYSTAGGGVASLGSVCVSTRKAQGVTGQPSPVGDPFDIDYVAHEMGHQFGANHTFNSTVCASNRNASTAYEPGSGSTIMAYAGICGSDDLQPNSDAYMHSISFDEIIAFINTGAGNNCDVPTATGNLAPTVNAGPDYTIPRGTYFTLTASGSDPNGDTLTYCWEQRDLGPAQSPTGADNGTSPLFRSFTGTTDPSRMFPRTTTPGGIALVKGERLPNTARTLRFRVTARDNLAGGGGVNTDDAQVVVDSASGPFIVTSPNTAVSWAGGSTQTVTWNVANSNLSPVNCANVKISLSTDGGATFPTVLVASTPNDGSESVVLPNPASNSSTNKIKVEAVGNVFFDYSNANFTITTSSIPAAPTGVTATPPTICGGSTTLTGSVPSGQTIDWFTGGCGTTLVGSGVSLVVSPGSTTTYFARARVIASGLVSATCASTTVTVLTPAVAPSSASSSRTGFCAGDTGTITLSADGGSGTTLEWYSGSCGGTLVGTGNNLVINSPSSDTTYFARWTNTCGPSACASVSVDVNEADLSGDVEGVPDGNVDLNDFFYFFGCYDAELPCADIDGNPGVDLGDFFLFFGLYDAGC